MNEPKVFLRLLGVSGKGYDDCMPPDKESSDDVMPETVIRAAAVVLGRRGGKRRVKKGFAMVDPDRRRELAIRGQAASVEARLRNKAEREAKR
jgi:hypothetical protein